MTLTDIQEIVNTVLQESECNEDFKALAFANMEQAIKYIIKRDFPEEVLVRYNCSLKYFRD
ncbi:hypothetical protein [Oceanobacillus sp. CAU 1775]